jgi:NAD(P)-dependent dehydrogenase (short-subunit alcohol dehydrogenase family)
MYDVVVTGSEGLIGRQLCEFFDSKGYNYAKLDLLLGHDLNDESFVLNWFKNNQSKSLVNLHGVNDAVVEKYNETNFRNISINEFNNIMNINVGSLFLVSREFINSNSKGVILNISSIYGVVSPRPEIYGGGEKNIAYGVSKAAVIQLTRHLAAHAAPNFRINCIVLGGLKANQNKKFIEDYSMNNPLKRMGEVYEVIPLIEYMISDKSSFMTGSAVTLDGGWTAI